MVIFLWKMVIFPWKIVIYDGLMAIEIVDLWWFNGIL